MKQKQFRLTEYQVDTLKRVALQRNCTETDIIRSFIDGLEGATQEVAPGKEEESALVAQLRADLDYERKRCDRLEDSLRLSLETSRIKELGAARRDFAEGDSSSDGAIAVPVTISGVGCDSDTTPGRWQLLRAFFRGRL